MTIHSQVVLAGSDRGVAKRAGEEGDVLNLVAGDLGESAADPVRVTSGLEVRLVELGEGTGAGEVSQHWWRDVRKQRHSLELLLEVLEGQGVLQDLSVGGGGTGIGTLVDGVCGGHGVGAKSGQAGEDSKGGGEHHCECGRVELWLRVSGKLTSGVIDWKKG